MPSTQIQSISQELLSLPLGQSVKKFLDYLIVEAGLSNNTVLAYGRDLKGFLKYCKSNKISRLQQIKPPLIHNYLRILAQEPKSTSLRGCELVPAPKSGSDRNDRWTTDAPRFRGDELAPAQAGVNRPSSFVPRGNQPVSAFPDTARALAETRPPDERRASAETRLSQEDQEPKSSFLYHILNYPVGISNGASGQEIPVFAR